MASAARVHLGPRFATASPPRGSPASRARPQAGATRRRRQPRRPGCRSARRASHQPGALLGDPAVMYVGVGLMVFRGESGPARQLRRGGEPGHLADLGDEDLSQDRTDARNLLHRHIAGVGAQSTWTRVVNRSISNRKSSSSRRREAIRAAYGAGSRSRSNSAVPSTPNRSLIKTWMPHLASTARTSASRSSRVASGAIHASGNRPRRSRSARSVATRTSFLTLRYPNAFTPNGWARCTPAPAARIASTAHYQP
jgi:hypothetical protein